MYGRIIWLVLRNTEAPRSHSNTASSVHSHAGSVFLTFPVSPHFVTARTLSSCADLWPRSKSMFCRDDLTTCSYFPPLHTTAHSSPSTKVRGHRAGSLLSSWHLEVRAARRSGAWGSASSTCRNTTSSSCWRTALSSCAPPGQTGPWPFSGSTSRGWRRFVWTQLKLQWLYLHIIFSYGKPTTDVPLLYFENQRTICVYMIWTRFQGLTLEFLHSRLGYICFTCKSIWFIIWNLKISYGKFSKPRLKLCIDLESKHAAVLIIMKSYQSFIHILLLANVYT